MTDLVCVSCARRFTPDDDLMTPAELVARFKGHDCQPRVVIAELLAVG